uniref:HAUS augmin-like complex, subunit 6 n=1 Tax=Labrus bergylta TaxID=56723 RepID=A0A3Q3G944_9LABR
MANPMLVQKKNGKYLWFALLGLGFQPDTGMSSIAGKTNINIKHINLGPNMFDKPNKDAFYIVTHFLLLKLNPSRFNEAFRHCWPVLNQKADVEFRKVTCAWLREIMDETANAGSKVVASLFLSPGGPKFVSLMLHLANYVMLQEMKTFTTDDSWVPEGAAMPASSFDMAVKRHNLTHSRFLKAAVDQDRFLHEYQKRAQILVKSKKEAGEECAKYDELLKYSSLTIFGYPKVRSLWSTVDEMLSTTKEEQQAVGSVLKGDVDRHVLDGTNRVLKIPLTLLERVEQLPNQLSSGNVYEAGQLNLLCVFELTNHALHLLREAQSRVSNAPKPRLSAEPLQEKCQQMARVLQELHLIRQTISKEGIPEVRSNIGELDAEWDKKWMQTLKETPLVSFLNEDPALGFLSPMAPLSFEPATDASYTSGIFSQFPASLLGGQNDMNENMHNVFLNRIYGKRFFFYFLQCCFYFSEEKPAESKSHDGLHDTSFNQNAVTTTSPTDGRVKGRDLESLLSTLHRDPFSTKKQLPRTPESLIMDVKNSWRKALQEDKAEKMGHSATFEDSVMGRLTPLDEPRNVLLSPDSSSKSFTCSMKPISTSGEVKTTLLWDTFNTEALDSPSGTGSSAVQFSLEHETLPEMPSCDSLLSLDDEESDMKSEDEDDFLIPALKSQEKRSPLATLHLSQQACADSSLMDRRKRTPECLLTGHMSPSLDKDWLMEPAKSNDATDKVFSLDLDTLETPSPAKKQEYGLPKLITFSPIDDMKC